MVKLENLKDGMILRLDSTIENPHADRRVTRNWTRAAMLEKGARFIVREDWEWAYPNGRETDTKRFWFRLENPSARHPGLYHIALHAKPHGPEDTQWFLGQEILRNASEPALTYADRWAQLNMEHANDFRLTLEVLIANGELSWTQIENAHKVQMCEWCDTIAVTCDVKSCNTSHCESHTLEVTLTAMRNLRGLAFTGSRIPTDRYPEKAAADTADAQASAAIAKARGTP